MGENASPYSAGVGLPMRPFLYTLDQIGTLLDIEQPKLKLNYIYFDRRSTGIPSRDLIMAHNIAPPNLPADWRVSEKELVRWFRRKGFKYYDRASVRG